MYRVYGDILSGNCYKIKLLMHFLNIDHEWLHIDIVAGESESTTFRIMNANAKIPVLEITNSNNTVDYISESNAILNYLADGSHYLPDCKFERAKVLQWQFFEQYSHEPYIAVARYINKYLGMPANRTQEYHSKQQGGHKALAVMEQQLNRSRFIASEKVSIADISLYAYTHVANEGGFSLAQYPAIINWLASIEAIPHYNAMTAPEPQ